jgi:hypothetical protein
LSQRSSRSGQSALMLVIVFERNSLDFAQPFKVAFQIQKDLEHCKEHFSVLLVVAIAFSKLFWVCGNFKSCCQSHFHSLVNRFVPMVF